MRLIGATSLFVRIHLGEGALPFGIGSFIRGPGLGFLPAPISLGVSVHYLHQCITQRTF